MDRNVGLWIDHKQAYLIWYKEGRVEVIPSNIEPPEHFSGGTQLGGKLNQKGDVELHHNDRYRLKLTKFYRQVVAALKDADAVFVMGPGAAKVEFEKVLKGLDIPYTAEAEEFRPPGDEDPPRWALTLSAFRITSAGGTRYLVPDDADRGICAFIRERWNRRIVLY